MGSLGTIQVSSIDGSFLKESLVSTSSSTIVSRNRKIEKTASGELFPGDFK